MLKFILSAAAIAAIFALPAQAAEAGAVLKPQAIIFDGKHLQNTKAGDEIVYNFSRKVSDQAQVGLPFDDKITLKVADVKDEKRQIDLQIYTGDRARELQRMAEMTINPIFIVTMQQAVASFRQMGGGDFNYLKTRFTKELDNNVVFEPCKIDFKGKTIDAYKISFIPFKDDPSGDKMRGYNKGSTFSMIVSPEVPGQFVETVSTIKSVADNTPSFEERTAIDGFGGMK